MLKIDTAALLQKEMDRKDFVKNVGIAILALSGVAAALKTIGIAVPSTRKEAGAAGYGMSAYGGSKKTV